MYIPTIPKFYEIMFAVYIYILVLQDGKYYVGISRDPENRFYKHAEGKTTAFVRDHLPIKDIRIKLLDSTDWQEALKEETRLAVELAEKFGIENVYGGSILGDLNQRTKRVKNYLKKHGGRR